MPYPQAHNFLVPLEKPPDKVVTQKHGVWYEPTGGVRKSPWSLPTVQGDPANVQPLGRTPACCGRAVESGARARARIFRGGCQGSSTLPSWPMRLDDAFADFGGCYAC